MTTQVWTAQRFTPDTLRANFPQAFDFSRSGFGGSNNAAVPTIDLRQYVRGGRLPYKYKISSLPDPCRYAPDRGVVSIPGAVGGSFVFHVEAYDAYGSMVSANITVILQVGPLSITNNYPDVHNGVPYDFTPLLVGGTPPYSCTFQGINLASVGLIFDTTTARLYTNGAPVIPINSPGNVYIVTVTDSANNVVTLNGAIGLLNP